MSKSYYIDYEELRTSRDARQAFYQSRLWRDLREQVLLENPLCEFCKDTGKIELATVVDHIVNIQEIPQKCLDKDNCRALCSEVGYSRIKE